MRWRPRQPCLRKWRAEAPPWSDTVLEDMLLICAIRAPARDARGGIGVRAPHVLAGARRVRQCADRLPEAGTACACLSKTEKGRRRGRASGRAEKEEPVRGGR